MPLVCWLVRKECMASTPFSRVVMRCGIAAGFIAALLGLALQPAGAADRVDPSTLTGKLIMGYQGWFACPGDGTDLGWRHWANGSAPAIDMLPDMTDTPSVERCKTTLRSADGHPVDLFSSHTPGIVERHLVWMQQYGLDGLAVQRFATDLLDPQEARARDIVLANVRLSAEAHGRVFFVMYDLSGLPPAQLLTVAQDWQRLQQNGLTRSPAYLHHRGHPLLGVWGLGFGDRPLTPEHAEVLLDALTQVSLPYGGVTFLGGLPSYWRSHKRDASSDRDWDRVWRRLGVISPWSVGRFADGAGADTYRDAVLAPDRKATAALGIDYMPVVFPGFSWANLVHSSREPDNAKPNSIPRRCGSFYWRQVHNALSIGASMVYGAMFDEVNEGTAMFKLLPKATEAPVEGVPPWAAFVTLDADGCQLPSDWYLRLAGTATAALHNRTWAPPKGP